MKLPNNVITIAMLIVSIVMLIVSIVMAYIAYQQTNIARETLEYVKPKPILKVYLSKNY